jgi:hypothetical protein
MVPMEDGHVMFVSDLSPLSSPFLLDHVVFWNIITHDLCV